MENSHLLATQPDGGIYVAVSEHNPYKELPVSDRSIQVQFGEDVHNIDTGLVEGMVRLEHQATFVQFMTILDFFMNLFDFVVLGNVVAAGLSMMALIGYWGTKTYNHVKILFYLFIQYALVIIKFSALTLTFQVQPIDYNMVGFFVFASVIQCYICYKVHTFYNTCLELPYFH